MEKVQVVAHTIKANGYIADEAAKVEFEGELLLTYNGGFRGEARVYRTKQGKIAILYSHKLFSEPVLRVHNSLEDVANFTEGYSDNKYPDYDRGIVGKTAEALGVEPPPLKLDI